MWLTYLNEIIKNCYYVSMNESADTIRFAEKMSYWKLAKFHNYIIFNYITLPRRYSQRQSGAGSMWHNVIHRMQSKAYKEKRRISGSSFQIRIHRTHRIHMWYPHVVRGMNHQAKIVRKTSIPSVLWFLLNFLPLKNDVTAPSKKLWKNFFVLWHLWGQ